MIMSDEEYESGFFRFKTSLHLFFLALKNYIISYKEWSDIERITKQDMFTLNSLEETLY